MTDAEQAFAAMFRMSGIKIFTMRYGGDHEYGACDEGETYPEVWGATQWIALERYLTTYPERFGIVASTFEALTIERPELREHYDRAKEAWEASQ